jgi:hypothetical protein
VSAVPSVRDPASLPRDGSRTRSEARTVYRADEDGVANSRFSEWDIRSGLPDDSREEDERAAERRLRDLRGRVKAARAAISIAPGAEEILRRDWVKAARFYGRFEISEAQFRHGVPIGVNCDDSGSGVYGLGTSLKWDEFSTRHS